MSAPLEVCVVGAGAIGSGFAYYLAQAGHTVTAVARPGSARLAQLERDQAVVLASGERAEVSVASAVDPAIEFDLLIITVLAHQLAPVLPQLAASKAREVVFMLNCWNMDPLTAAAGVDRARFGMPLLQAFFPAGGDGKLDVSHNFGATLSSSRTLIDALKGAKVPAVYEPEGELWVRCHAPMCISFESLCARAKPRNTGATWAEAIACARGAHAIWDLLGVMGSHVYPASKVWMYRLPPHVLACMFWTLSRVPSFRELLATGELEASALCTEVLKSAEAQERFPSVKVDDIRAMVPGL